MSISAGCLMRSAPAPAPKPAPKPVYVAIDASDPILSQFSKDDLGILQRYLAASPHWRLTRDQGCPVAYHREVSEFPGGERALRWSGDSGYYLDWSRGRPSGSHRVLIRFDGNRSTVAGEISKYASYADAGSSHVHLKVVKANGSGYDSYLCLVGKSGIDIEIMEESSDLSRRLTQRLLHEVNAEFAECLRDRSVIARQGYIDGLDQVQIGETATIRVQEHNGECQVWGYVNPGEWGYTYLKVYDTTTNRTCLEDMGEMPFDTTEYVGWSPNPKVLFFFNSLIYTGRSQDLGSSLMSSERYPARFELWFHPADGKPDSKLLQAVAQVQDYNP